MKQLRYKTLRLVILTLLLIFVTGCGDKKISGEVKDIFNNPIAGVEISIKNSAFTTLTDEEGKYSIDYVPGDIELLFKHQEYIGGNLKINLSTKENFPAKKISLYPSAKKTGMYNLNVERKELIWLKDKEVYSSRKSIPYIKDGKNTFVLYLEEEATYSVRDFIFTNIVEKEKRKEEVKGTSWSSFNAAMSNREDKKASAYNLKITKLDEHHLRLDVKIPDSKIFFWKIGATRRGLFHGEGIAFHPIFHTTSDEALIERERICSSISRNTVDDSTIEFLNSIKEKNTKFCYSTYGSKISLYEYANLKKVNEEIVKIFPTINRPVYTYSGTEDMQRLLFKFFNKSKNKVTFIYELLRLNLLTKKEKENFFDKLEKMQTKVYNSIDVGDKNIDLALSILYYDLYGEKKLIEYIKNSKYQSFHNRVQEIKKFIESENLWIYTYSDFSKILTKIESITDIDRRKKVIRQLLGQINMNNKFTFEDSMKLFSYLDIEVSFPMIIDMADRFIDDNKSFVVEEFVDKMIVKRKSEGKDYLLDEHIVRGLIKLGQIDMVQPVIKKALRNPRKVALDRYPDDLLAYYIKEKEFRKVDRFYSKVRRVDFMRQLYSSSIYNSALQYNEIDFAKKYAKDAMAFDTSKVGKMRFLTYSLHSKNKAFIRSSLSSYFSLLKEESSDYKVRVCGYLFSKIHSVKIDDDIKNEILYEIELIVDGIEDDTIEMLSKRLVSSEVEKELKKKNILYIIKNGSNRQNYPMGAMPPHMATDKDAEVIATWIANDMKGIAPRAFASCSACHGADGRGMNGMAPNLHKLSKRMITSGLEKDNESIFSKKIVKNEKRPVETKKVKVKDSHKKFWNDVEKISLLKGNVSAGEALYGMCGGCHMDDARKMGGVKPPSLDHAGTIYEKKFLIALIKDPAIATNVDHKYPNGTMTHPMGSISMMVNAPQDIANVVAFLKAKKAESVTPKEVYVEACSRCHSSDDAIYLNKSEQDLRAWIENPQSMVNGTSMPKVGLTGAGVTKVIEYLRDTKDKKSESNTVPSQAKNNSRAFSTQELDGNIHYKISPNSVHFDIEVTNNHQSSKSGGVSVSFPNLESSSRIKKIKSQYGLYKAGNKLWNGTEKRAIISRCLMLEKMYPAGWRKGEKKILSFDVNTNNLKSLQLNIRALLIMQNKEEKLLPDGSNTIDQQGYPVETLSIEL